MIKYDEVEFDGEEAIIKFKGEEIDRVFLDSLVREFLSEQGYELV